MQLGSGCATVSATSFGNSRAIAGATRANWASRVVKSPGP